MQRLLELGDQLAGETIGLFNYLSFPPLPNQSNISQRRLNAPSFQDQPQKFEPQAWSARRLKPLLKASQPNLEISKSRMMTCSSSIAPRSC